MTIRLTNAAILQATLSSIADIAALHLTLLVFPERCLFTGEHPVVHINPSGESSGYGVLTAERLYMPVSTTHAHPRPRPLAPLGRVAGDCYLWQR